MSPASTATVTAAAGVALVLHVWGLYRDQGPPSYGWFPQLDKVEHLVGFGLPCVLVLVALHLNLGPLRARTVGVVVGLFLVHAVVSEVLQGALYTTRSGDPLDALSDVVGTALGLFGYLLIRRRLPQARRARA